LSAVGRHEAVSVLDRPLGPVPWGSWRERRAGLGPHTPSSGERGHTASGALTARQRDVLPLVAEGRGTQAIATLLNVSGKTVESHQSRIVQQLDFHTTGDLTKYVIAYGITGLSHAESRRLLLPPMSR